MPIPHPSPPLNLCGDRFRVTYHVAGDEPTARARAEDICVEQTVEFPADLVPEGPIRTHIFGCLEAFAPLEAGTGFRAVISYAAEVSGFELPQLLNVVFGNISLKPGILVAALELPACLLEAFRGPRFGVVGLRERAGVHGRPLLCTALKPMGLSPAQLADLAYQFALGGVDLIKDDHGLADQPFCPFQERVARCAEAVDKANRERGGRCLYFPNATSRAGSLLAQAHFARLAGAGGLVITPGLTGIDAMRQVADEDDIALPLMSHPAFIGSFVTAPGQGIAHYALYGQVMRLAGADATIFPNYGGRFSFSEIACRGIVEGAAAPMGHIRRIFPAPGGGMSLERIAEMRRFYGDDAIFLVGGDLHRGQGSLVERVAQFRAVLED